MGGAIQSWLESLTLESLTLVRLVDWGLALLSIGLVIYWSRRTRAAVLIRGFVIVLALYLATDSLPLMHLLLNYLLIGAAVGTGILFQPEIRSLLEYLGRGDWLPILPSSGREAETNSGEEDYLEELIQAIKDLSRNRTGALVVIETEQIIDPRIFTDAGVPLNSHISRELVQTIFQTSTPLHDGALIMNEKQIKAAGVILPMSERVASRQLGTRHRAAIGISEQTNCLCVVVSEETGSISLAEAGKLVRPLTSNQLRDLLVDKLRPTRALAVESPLHRLGSGGLLTWGQRLLRALPDPIQKILSKE
ncbi:MAG: TIGR00159 family protein [Synechococcaceae cyanobacterium SM2_3_2]|nr:TIGR00159 family protein [Synechococcaceae cyanobacterium SM2_3_2]